MARALRVLLIDDNNDDITLIQLAAQSAGGGHTFCSVDRAKKAIDLLEHKPAESLPDLLLVDLRMPEMDGFQFLRWLQQHHRLRIPAVVLSSSFLEQDIDEAYRLGARSFLSKPFAYEELVRDMKSFLAFWSECLLPNRQKSEA